MFDIYTLIFLALAVFIFLRLRSVLGQRSGSERPPYDIPVSRDAVNRDTAAASGADKVVPLQPRNVEQGAESALDLAAEEAKHPSERWKDLIAPGMDAEGLNAVMKADPAFDLAEFATGARGAYEMIVGAFAAGDRRALKIGRAHV